MKTNFSLIRSILICLCLLGSIVSTSAQHQGVALTTKDQLQFYHDEGLYYFFRYNDLRGQTFNPINQYLKKNSLSPKEYTDMDIAKSKHPLLRTISLLNISSGSTIIATEQGSVRLIYASKKENNNELAIYVYLISTTVEGKYIDSLFSGERFYLDLSNRENELRPNEEGMCVKNNQIILLRGDGDGGEIEIPYIVTKELKFKKI